VSVAAVVEPVSFVIVSVAAAVAVFAFGADLFSAAIATAAFLLIEFFWLKVQG
jgi:hypothetical protein